MVGPEGLGERRCVTARPPVVNEPERDRVQEVQLLPAQLARGDEPGPLEHAEVLRDPEARHGKTATELLERLPVPLAESIEELAPALVGERLEHLVHATGYR